ncbi:MAG TPA: DUF1565 domain-containing protein [bacterium]|nr:DUF1565 domain-containing protein [bacterium]
MKPLHRRYLALSFAVAALASCRTSVPGSGGGLGGTGGGSGGAPSSPLACTLRGAGQGPSGNKASDFPTISGLDFAAFPRDPGDCTGAHVFHVSTAGSDANPGTPSSPFKTIARAIAAASAGDAILVGGGSYPEGADGEYRSLVIDKAIRLCAASGEGVTVTPRSSSVTYGAHILADGVVVSGVNLSDYVTGVEIGGEGRTAVRNIVLKNLTVTAAGNTFKNGIVASAAPVDGLLLKNVSVRGATLGISCSNGPCKNWRLDGVTVCNDANDAGGSGGDGIAVEVRDEDAAAGNLSQNILITNAEVTGASADGIDLKAARAAVFNANVHDNLRNGVKFWRGGDLVNSFVVNHGADASLVFDREGAYRVLNSLVAFHNVNADGTLRGDSYTATVCYDFPSAACSLSILNSVFFNNSGSIFLSPATTAEVRNSLLGKTANGIVIEKAGVTVTEGDPVTALAGVAAASADLAFTTDPLFTNAAAGDFSFGSSSALRNAGAAPALFPAYDFSGKARTTSAAPDLGPLELF